MLIYDAKTEHVEREKAIRMLQANVAPSVIAQRFRCHGRVTERLRNVSDKLERCQNVRIHDVIGLRRDVKIDKSGGLN